MKDITNYLEKTQADAMLEAAAACNTRDYLTIRMLWRTGVRVDEMLHIRPRDIERHNKVVNIVKAKGGKQRRVPLDSETLTPLNAYVTTRSIGDDTPIFSLSQRGVRALVARYGKLIGKDVHPHTFRHSYAINMVRHGVDIRRLQQVLGHASLNMTAVYLQDVYARVPF
jgi:site-specific recombinase XerD